MRSCALLIPALLSAAAAHAASSAPSGLRAPVEVAVMGFQAKLEDGRVILGWRRYKRGDFKSYVVLKSLDAQPGYPETPPLTLSDYVDTVRFDDGRLVPGTWHYRLCILTRYGDRWVSPVVTVVVGPDDVRHDPPTEADFD